MRSIRFAATVTLIQVLFGCGQDEFQQKILSSKAEKMDQAAAPGEGMPYFLKLKMNPTWNVSEPENLARVTEMKFLDHRRVSQSANIFTQKPSFVAFFYGSCTGLCPMIMKTLKKLEEDVGHKIGAQFIAISVDPDNDSPEKLSRYVKKLFKGRDPKNWHFLTGTEGEVERLVNGIFSIEAFRKPDNQRVVHSERIFFVDQKGFIRAVINSTSGKLNPQTKEALLAKSF